MKKIIVNNVNIYEIYYTLINESKIAPLERIFEFIFKRSLELSDGSLEKTKQLINNQNLNILIKDIKVIE